MPEPPFQSVLKKLGLYRQAQSIYHRRYRRRRVKFYSMFVKSGDTCFDVGAHIGSRIEVFLSLGAHVIAVEPQTTCFKLLNMKYSKNPDVVLINKGLDETEGTRTLYLSDSEALSSMSETWIQVAKSSRRFSNHTWARKEEAQVTTLDRLIDNYGLPSFCKIDVEGFEAQVVKGLSKRIPTLSFEFNPEFRAQAKVVMDRLDSIGDYTFNYSIGEDMSLRLKTWMTRDTIEQEVESLSDAADIYAKVACQNASI
jgi:FkbM family methyltransferase